MTIQNLTGSVPVRAAFEQRILPDLTRLQRRIIFVIALAACIIRLVFWAYTDRNWEDALITVLHSENFASGLGLTHYHPGQAPVHGFTSPLSVLIPLVADFVHVGWGLGFLKFVSALLSIPTVVLAAAVASHRAFHVNVWLVYLLCGYLAFEHHQILWGMAGMETQVAVFVLFLTLYSVLIQAPTALGISMALCLYARPDFAIFLIPVVAYIFLTAKTSLIRILSIAGGTYAPWLIFTTLYYGSPVPHTILAKNLGYSRWTARTPFLSQAFWSNTWARIHDWIFLPMGPAFAGHGSGFIKFADDGLISRMCILVILLGCAAMIFRFHKFYIIPLGSLLAYSLYYIYFVPAIFGWYLVPFSAINCLLLVFALNALFDTFILPIRIPVLSQIACVAYLLPFIVIVPVTFKAERDIQRYIEDPVRKAVGEYLFAHKKPGQTVGAEPLGYIAYYSRMPEYDYPGLASREVTDFLQKNPGRRMLEQMLEFLRPDWIALRGYEFTDFTRRPDMRFLDTDYQVEKIFRADPAFTSTILDVEHNIDTSFYLLKKSSHGDQQLPSSGVGPELPGIDITSEGSWKIEGGDPAIGPPPGSWGPGKYFGSWAGRDANTGTIRLGPFRVNQESASAVPLATGPDNGGLSVKVLNFRTGQPIAVLNPVPLRNHWWAWSVALPPDPEALIQIVAEDSGTQWGQWLALGIPHSVSFPRLGALLKGGSVGITGAWKIDGQDPAVGNPPLEGTVYGSWIGSDANTGRLHLGPYQINAGTGIAIPLVSGPRNEGLSVTVLNHVTGKLIASLNPVPLHNAWWAWKVPLPAGLDESVDIVAEDSGVGWGQWLAIGLPHALQ